MENLFSQMNLIYLTQIDEVLYYPKSFLILTLSILNNQNYHWGFIIFNIAKIILNEINIILIIILVARFLFRPTYLYLSPLSSALAIPVILFIEHYLIIDFINLFELID